MEAEEENKKISGRSSRQDIWAAYNELAQSLEQKQVAMKLDSEESGAKTFSDLSELKMKMTQTIDKISDELTTSLGNVGTIKTEILKEKRDILDEMNGRRVALEEEIENAKRSWRKERVQKIEEEEEGERKRALLRKREEDEYGFALEKKRREENDKFERELVGKREDIKLQADEIAKRKTEITAMEKEIAASPAQIEKAISGAKAEQVKELEQKHAAEIKEMKLIFQNKEDLAKARTDNLAGIVGSQKTEVANLNKQLSEASAQLKEIAVSVIESRSEQKKETQEV